MLIHTTVKLSQQLEKSVMEKIRLGVPVMFHTKIKLAPIFHEGQLNMTTCTNLIIFSCVLLVGLKSNLMSMTPESLVRVSSWLAHMWPLNPANMGISPSNKTLFSGVSHIMGLGRVEQWAHSEDPLAADSVPLVI